MGYVTGEQHLKNRMAFPEVADLRSFVPALHRAARALEEEARKHEERRGWTDAALAREAAEEVEELRELLDETAHAGHE